MTQPNQEWERVPDTGADAGGFGVSNKRRRAMLAIDLIAKLLKHPLAEVVADINGCCKIKLVWDTDDDSACWMIVEAGDV
jgi:hypothetical protein